MASDKTSALIFVDQHQNLIQILSSHCKPECHNGPCSTPPSIAGGMANMASKAVPGTPNPFLGTRNTVFPI